MHLNESMNIPWNLQQRCRYHNTYRFAIGSIQIYEAKTFMSRAKASNDSRFEDGVVSTSNHICRNNVPSEILQITFFYVARHPYRAVKYRSS